MRLTSLRLEEDVASLAELAERYGIALDLPANGPLAIETEPDGSQRFKLVGFLPDSRRPPRAVIRLAEKWRPVSGGVYERSAYRYELIDHERDLRRAFHMHHAQEFERRFGVVVHEHCESPIGHAQCAHYFGPPVRDGFRAIEILMTAWVSDPPDWAALPCLEPI